MSMPVLNLINFTGDHLQCFEEQRRSIFHVCQFLDVKSARHQVMVAYLWLVWYEASSKLAPKHWALAVTYETNDRAYATFYETSGDSASSRIQPKVVRRVHITSNHGVARYGGKLLLGEIIDSVLGALEMYSETAVELVNAHNRKRGTGEASSQDWAVIIIRSLEDAQLLPQGILARVEKCPRSG